MTLAHTDPTSREAQQIDVESFRHLSRIIHEESGIVLPDGKRNLVASRLSRRLRELNISGFDEYCRLLDTSSGMEERDNLVSLLTTNVTRFFREEHHFNSLRNSILPPLIERARRGGKIRIWSAGCSTGEEPYSIAMCIAETCPDAANLDIRILATDIDRNVIRKAESGEYADIDERHLPKALRDRYFNPNQAAPSRLRIQTFLKEMISFNVLNLLREWPMQRKFDVIFCRNVVIYFDRETQTQLWRRLTAQLELEGHLMIGHSERIDCSAELDLQPSGITQYRRTSIES